MEPHNRQGAQLRIEGKERPWIEISGRVDHHRVRKLVRGSGEQSQGECELAASSIPGQEHEPAPGQASNSGQAIELGTAGPVPLWAALPRPPQRPAPET